jgi:hypothetical protein
MVGVRRLTCALILAALFTPLFADVPVAAQSWPTRPIKFILTLGPGSGQLLRWFVLWLFADFFFRPDNLPETIARIRLETFVASRHSFVAGCQ